MKKVLMLAGIDMARDLKDPEKWEIVQDVLKNFDPNQEVSEDDLIFSARQM